LAARLHSESYERHQTCLGSSAAMRHWQGHAWHHERGHLATSAQRNTHKIATKTMYGHTIGEVLTLSVALERTVDKVCAASLAQGEWAQETLIELVLDQIRVDQKLKVLRQVLASIFRGALVVA